MAETKKTVLITGASSGFGLATAKLLAENGYRLVLVARSLDKLEAVKAELNTPVFVAQLDVQDRRAVRVFFDSLPSSFADIDIVVNNAGLALGLDSVFDADLDDWDTMVDTNIKGLLYVTRHALPILKEKNFGHIVNIGSIAGAAAYKGGNIYGATKAFVAHFSRELRADLFGTDIRVTNVAPGIAETNFSLVRFKGDAERAGSVYENFRHLNPEDVAEAVLWVITRPPHVNIDEIQIMPTDQTWGGLVVNRERKQS